jgi:hypothetical protein
MNTKATAKQIMSAIDSDAFTQEACEKILEDNLSGDPQSYKAGENHAVVTLPAQSSQPKPESWLEIAREAATTIANLSAIDFSCFADYHAKRGKLVNEMLLPIILAAIERSHAAPKYEQDDK